MNHKLLNIYIILFLTFIIITFIQLIDISQNISSVIEAILKAKMLIE